MCILRAASIIGKIVLACSFASVLLAPLGHHPFVFSIYGFSDTGKTVMLRVASSVWGNPQKYMLTFNSTNNAIEANAALLKDLPVCIDEQQTAVTNGVKEFQGLIYNICEGKSRSRAKRDGSVRKTRNYSNTVIVSGEQPINSDTANDGAKNRVVEIRVKDKILPSRQLSELYFCVNHNYGFAGKEFLRLVIAAKDFLPQRLVEYTETLKSLGVESKQAMIGAFILLADRISHPIFDDYQILSATDLVPFLRKENEASAAEIVVANIYGLIAANISHFDAPKDFGNFECWGTYDKEFYYLTVPKFNALSRELGFNKQVVIDYLIDNNLTHFNKHARTYTTKVNGITTRTIPFRVEPHFLKRDDV